MYRKLSQLLFAVALASTTHVAAAPAYPDEDRTNTSLVRTSDPDLDTPAGAHQALMRIEREANRVCRNDGGLPNWRFSEFDQCRKDATSHAIARLNAPMVATAYAQSRAPHVERLAATHTILLAAAVMYAAQASAETSSSVDDAMGAAPFRIVRLADIDVGTASGAERALHRIDLAARDLCAFPGAPHWFSSDFRACHEKVMASAVARLNAPLVSSLYAQSRSRPATQLAAH